VIGTSCQAHDTGPARERTLVLKGDLDIASAVDVRFFVVWACAGGASKIVLDLIGLTLTDSTGLSAILGSRNVCRDQAVELILAPAPAGLLDL
jgi:anti-anti-sigma factor